jgi:hypothetical protein
VTSFVTRHRKQTYLQRALADKNSVDISPPWSGHDDYLIGIEIFDRRDGTPQLLSLHELSTLAPDEGELAIVIGEGSTWVADGKLADDEPPDDNFVGESDEPGDSYQPVVNVFLLRRLDGKILTLTEEADSFEAMHHDPHIPGDENGDLLVNLGRSQTLSGTGAGTPWKQVLLETTILCHSQTHTKTLTARGKPMGFSFEQVSVNIEHPGKAVTGVRIVMEDAAQWGDEWTCTSMEELLHVVETPTFALRWA